MNNIGLSNLPKALVGLSVVLTLAMTSCKQEVDRLTTEILLEQIDIKNSQGKKLYEVLSSLAEGSKVAIDDTNFIKQRYKEASKIFTVGRNDAGDITLQYYVKDLTYDTDKIDMNGLPLSFGFRTTYHISENGKVTIVSSHLSREAYDNVEIIHVLRPGNTYVGFEYVLKLDESQTASLYQQIISPSKIEGRNNLTISEQFHYLLDATTGSTVTIKSKDYHVYKNPDGKYILEYSLPISPASPKTSDRERLTIESANGNTVKIIEEFIQGQYPRTAYSQPRPISDGTTKKTELNNVATYLFMLDFVSKTYY